MKFGIIAFWLLLSVRAHAAIRVDTINYRSGKEMFEGRFLIDDLSKEPKPGILILPQWMGITDHELSKAQSLVKEGYAVFIADVYGRGIHPSSTNEAAKLSSNLKSQRRVWRDRLLSSLDVLESHPQVDKSKVGVIGFCFGGLGALEVLRSGRDIQLGASFHGSLGADSMDDVKKINAPAMIFHGGSDPLVPPAEVDQFKKQMDQAKKVYDFVQYDDAVHAFTQKMAGSDSKAGVAYNEKADLDSWSKFLTKFKAIVGNQSSKRKTPSR